MTPGDAFLLRFLRELREWSDRIRRASYAETVTMARVQEGVEVRVTWRNRDDTEGEYRRVLTLEDLLGSSRALHPHAWVLQKRHCGYAREIIAGVLGKRGV